MPDIPPEQAEDKCPNCESVILSNNNWCPKCGYNKHNIEFSGNNRGYYRFSWLWFLGLFIVVPAASCGGCIALNTGKEPSNTDFMVNTAATNIAFILMILSLVTGVIMAVWNLIEGRD